SPPVQPGWPSAARAVRDGDSELRAAGAGGTADHRVRRRDAVAQLYLRGGCREGYGSLDRRTPRDRPGLQHRKWQGDLDPGACRESQEADRQHLGDRDGAVRESVRSWIRGYAATGTRHPAHPGAGRIPPDGRARRDAETGDRALSPALAEFMSPPLKLKARARRAA